LLLEHFCAKKINAAQLADTVSLVKNKEQAIKSRPDLCLSDFSIYMIRCLIRVMLGNISPQKYKKIMAEKAALKQFTFSGARRTVRAAAMLQLNAADL